MTMIKKAVLHGDKQYGDSTTYSITLLDEDGNSVGVGGEETAELVALDIETDTDWDTIPVVQLVYKDEAAERDWLTLNEDGTITLGDDAGGVFVSIRLKGTIDFSGTTTPEDGDKIEIVASLHRDGQNVGGGNGVTTRQPLTADGVIEIFEFTPSSPAGSTTLGGVLDVSVSAYQSREDELNNQQNVITDGVATVDLAVNVTRLSPAPTFS